MASIKVDDLLTSVKPFDPNGEPSSIGRRWQQWLKGFSLYADSKGLIIQADKTDNKVQRRALLLHCAGEQVQEIFETLADTGTAAEYERRECVKRIFHSKGKFDIPKSSFPKYGTARG